MTFRTILVDGRVAGNIVAGTTSTSAPSVTGSAARTEGVASRRGLPHGCLRDRDDPPLYAHVAKHNTGSIRVLEQCGFALAGERGPEPDDEVEELLLRLG